MIMNKLHNCFVEIFELTFLLLLYSVFKLFTVFFIVISAFTANIRLLNTSTF